MNDFDFFTPRIRIETFMAPAAVRTHPLALSSLMMGSQRPAAVAVAALLLLATTVAAGDGLELQFGERGAYSLRLGAGEPWLRSAPTTIRAGGLNYSTADGSLHLVSNHSMSGKDAIGDFSSTTVAYAAGSALFETEFRVYSSPVAAVVFEQRFPEGASGTANNCSHAQATLLSAFPSFDLNTTAHESDSQGPQAYVQFAGKGVPTASGCQMGPWPPNPNGPRSAHSCQSGGSLDRAPATTNRLSSGWEAAGAIAVFDGQANTTLVLSPYAGFTTTQAVHTEAGALSFGPRGSLESVPAGFTAGAIAVAGSGIGRTMREWGLALMRKGGKDPDAWKADYSLKYLGYTTDNGAYYYYKTEENKNYEETVLDLKQYTLDERIPVQWILYDSWFYAKANGTATGSGMMSPSHAALNWSDADPAVFPSGLRSVYRATGWPVVAHARAWASEKEGNVYAKADPQGWIESRDTTGETIGLPVTAKFWDELFANAREWGCLQYQQDWMYTQASMEAMLTNATLSRLWHMQMTDALSRHGMRFGFGGVQPTDWLMSTEQQAVTNGRISDDYHANLKDEGALNWNIGTASIFGWALSVLPAKDGWWSTPDQPGHPYKDNRTEDLGALHAAVATLSRGPVSPADKIGLFNRSQIMRSCMDDGTLLSPDRPALALDSSLLYRALHGVGPAASTSAALQRKAPSAEIWSTYSIVGGLAYRHILVPLNREPYLLTLDELAENDGYGAAASGTSVVVENGADVAPTATVALAAEGSGGGVEVPICDRNDFKLYHTVPLLPNGWGLVGETAKWIPVSAARIRNVAYASSSGGGNSSGTGGPAPVTLQLTGVANEKISFGFVHAAVDVVTAAGGTAGGVRSDATLPITYVNCVFGATGTLTMTPSGCIDRPW